MNGGQGRVTVECTVEARFVEPPQALRACFTSFYLVEVDVPAGQTVVDYLHPEWGGFRIADGLLPGATIPGRPELAPTHFSAQGPTSCAARFVAGSFRMWGVGLLPLGWAKFVGIAASDLCNTLVDGSRHAAFARFSALADTLFDDRPDSSAELARIEAFFSTLEPRPVPDEDKIVACHAALLDPEVASVADMAERCGLPGYTLERLCRRHFGFSPQLLLRRQRFMRSLAQFMLDPTLRWIGAIDDHYYDQAQFVRDFHQFMGMSPSEYASVSHPILSAVMRARQRAAGAAVQALHAPEGAPRLAALK